MQSRPEKRLLKNVPYLQIYCGTVCFLPEIAYTNRRESWQEGKIFNLGYSSSSYRTCLCFIWTEGWVFNSINSRSLFFPEGFSIESLENCVKNYSLLTMFFVVDCEFLACMVIFFLSLFSSFLSVYCNITYCNEMERLRVFVLEFFCSEQSKWMPLESLFMWR